MRVPVQALEQVAELGYLYYTFILRCWYCDMNGWINDCRH